MPRFCNQCGTPLRDGARFCPNCGKTIEQPSFQQQAQPQYQQAQPQYQQVQPQYQQPQPTYQQPPKKKGGFGIVALVVVLIVIIAGGAGFYYFKFKPDKERKEEILEQSMSTVINSQETATPQKVEKAETPAAKPQKTMGTGKVKVKEAEFFGVTLPIPDIGTVTENKTVDKGSGNEVITIRYDGISYQEYIEYCKQLESINGWKSLRGKAASLPEDYNNGGTMVTFTGFYRSPLYVNVYYLSDYYRDGSDWPPFALELMNF